MRQRMNYLLGLMIMLRYRNIDILGGPIEWVSDKLFWLASPLMA